MNRPLWLLPLSLLAAGCTCGAFDPAVTRFACSTDDDCGSGSVCAPAGGGKECVLANATGGGGGATGGGEGGGGGGGATGGGGGNPQGGGGGGEVTDGGLDGGGLDAGTDAGRDAGPGDAGTDGGTAAVPDHLVITTPAQTLLTSTCSNALTVEVRDALDRPVAVAGNLGLSLSSSLPQVTFFNGAGCLGPNVVTTTVLSGASSTTLSFRSLQAGSAVLTITSLTLRPGSVAQTETVTSPPTSLVFLSAAPTTPLAGLCFQATVEARGFNASPANVAADTSISLQSAPVDGLRFFSSANCTGSTAITSTVILTGQSRASFYVKTITGGSDTVTATASFGSATLMVQVTGVVRKGTCTLSSLVPSVTCPISPPLTALSKTLVVYQATTNTNRPEEYEVRCTLSAVDTLTCEHPGNTLFNPAANINWQAAELDTGLQVTRAAASSCPTPLNRLLPLVPLADPTSSFVLSSFSGTGANFDGDDLSAMRLVPDAGAVFLDNRDFAGMGCTGYEYQVVQLSGVTTLRGGTGAMAQGQRKLIVPGLPAASVNTVLLNQAVMSANPLASLSMCNLLVRSELTTPTSLTFSRGADQINPANCSEVAISDLPWQRVDFGSRAQVQAFTVPLNGNSFNVTIAAVDVTRTIVFAGGQLAGGQSSGETAYDNTNDDTIGPAQARFDLQSATSVRVVRAAGNSSGIITLYVVELEP